VSDEASLETLTSENTFVLVDFFADWCPACQKIAPDFSELAMNYNDEGTLTFARVDTEAAKDLAIAYNIESIPTFILFKNGAIVDSVQGADLNAVIDMV
ncbi:thioredoxin-like protein, partial [Microthyrium microscopicum]